MFSIATLITYFPQNLIKFREIPFQTLEVYELVYEVRNGI